MDKKDYLDSSGKKFKANNDIKVTPKLIDVFKKCLNTKKLFVATRKPFIRRIFSKIKAEKHSLKEYKDFCTYVNSSAVHKKVDKKEL